LGWTKGALSFRNTPLRDVAAQLSRWYDMDFVVSDAAIGQLPLTTMVRTSDPVDSVMKIISLTTNTQVKRQGRTVTISRALQPVCAPELITKELAVHGDSCRYPSSQLQS